MVQIHRGHAAVTGDERRKQATDATGDREGAVSRSIRESEDPLSGDGALSSSLFEKVKASVVAFGLLGVGYSRPVCPSDRGVLRYLGLVGFSGRAEDPNLAIKKHRVEPRFGSEW